MLGEPDPTGLSPVRAHSYWLCLRSPASRPKQPLSQGGTLKCSEPLEDKGLTEAPRPGRGGEEGEGRAADKAASATQTPQDLEDLASGSIDLPICEMG